MTRLGSGEAIASRRARTLGFQGSERVAGFFQPSIPVGLFLDLRRTKDDGFWAGVSIADAAGYATIATPNLPPAPDPDMRTEEEKKAATEAAKVPSTPSVSLERRELGLIRHSPHLAAMIQSVIRHSPWVGVPPSISFRLEPSAVQ